MQCHLGLYHVAPWGDFVGTYSRHTLHHTGYTENYTQHIVDSQGVACFPSLWFHPWFSDSCTRGWCLHICLISQLRSPSCLRTEFADFWSVKGTWFWLGLVWSQKCPRMHLTNNKSSRPNQGATRYSPRWHCTVF